MGKPTLKVRANISGYYYRRNKLWQTLCHNVFQLWRDGYETLRRTAAIIQQQYEIIWFYRWWIFFSKLALKWTLLFRESRRVKNFTTGSPSSKYENRRASALLRSIQNIMICMGKKPIVSVTYQNERISIKKQFTLLKMCGTSLLCGPRADLWDFM